MSEAGERKRAKARRARRRAIEAADNATLFVPEHVRRPHVSYASAVDSRLDRSDRRAG